MRHSSYQVREFVVRLRGCGTANSFRNIVAVINRFCCVRVACICGVGTLSLAAPSPLPECVVLPSGADTAHVDMYSPVTMTSDAAHENKRWSVGSGDVVHAWSV